MKLGELLDRDLLNEHVNAHVVNVQHHPALPLSIYNYGQKATFNNLWDDVTCKCRGLIVDKTNDEVIARPFAKFFNLETGYRPETAVANLPATIPEITEKLDGSLGILYRYKGFVGVSTRGSFASDQATWASAWYNRHLPHAIWPEGWTPLFEIIYPDNRIVVKYEWEGLALLSLVHVETGEEMRQSEVRDVAWSNGCREIRQFNKTLAQCRAENGNNAEGYVLTWHNGHTPPLKIKVKFLEYMRLHHLLTGISPKELWNMLREEQSFDELTHDVPEHYAQWVNSWKAALEAEYGRIEQKAKAVYANCRLPKNGSDKEARKALAEYFTAGDLRPISGVLFKMLDGELYDETIWKMCRPMVAGLQGFKPVNE